jgi:hypothetical protein
MRSVVCVGGGRVGSQAAIDARGRGDRALVIDVDRGCLASRKADRKVDSADALLDAKPGEIVFLRGDGIASLLSTMDTWTPDLVVPASSGHMAAKLAVESLEGKGRIVAPAGRQHLLKVEKSLPRYPFVLSDPKNGVIVTSHMAEGSLCLDGCDQPATCPVSGVSFSVPMHRSLQEALERSVDRHFVLSTTGAGVFGAIPGENIKEMLASLESLKNRETCGIATACRCHGFVNLLQLR